MSTGDIVLLYLLWFVMAFGLAAVLLKKAS